MRPGIVVRTGRIGARGDDGEVHSMMPFGQDASTQLGRHLGFGTAYERDVALLQIARDAIDAGSSRAQSRDLVGILHRAKDRGDRRGARPCRRRQFTHEVDEKSRPRGIANGDVGHRPHERRHNGDRVVGLAPRS